LTAGAAPPLDPGRILWLNNTLQILSTVAWYVVAPFIPLYLAAQGAPAGVIGAIIGFSGVVPLLIALHAGALVDERGSALVTQAAVILYAVAGVMLTALRAVSLAMAHRLVHTILRERGVGAVLFISFIVVCAQTLQQTFYPLYLSTVGLSPTLIGIVIAAISLGSMVVRSLLSRGVDRFGY